MKFAEIKVGDIVYLDNPVSFGWRNEISFYCAYKVTKVTPKNFYVGDKMYRKGDGSIVKYGSWERAKQLGDSKGYGTEIVSDETNKRELFIKKRDALSKISTIAAKATVNKLDLVTIEELEQSLKILEKLI